MPVLEDLLHEVHDLLHGLHVEGQVVVPLLVARQGHVQGVLHRPGEGVHLPLGHLGEGDLPLVERGGNFRDVDGVVADPLELVRVWRSSETMAALRIGEGPGRVSLTR